MAEAEVWGPAAAQGCGAGLALSGRGFQPPAPAPAASGVQISLNLTAGPALCLHCSGCSAERASWVLHPPHRRGWGGSRGVLLWAHGRPPDSTAWPTGLHPLGPWAGHEEGERGAVCVCVRVRVCAHVCACVHVRGFRTATEGCRAAGVGPAHQTGVPGGRTWRCVARRTPRAAGGGEGHTAAAGLSTGRGRWLPLLGLHRSAVSVRERHLGCSRRPLARRGRDG